MSLGEFAERANISVNTMKGYRKDGRLPGEDGEVGRNRGWLPETADEWIAALAR
ncbi:transcriptional regulator [Rhodococcus qingshengii]|nr:transcriptional regulator [Rhodococcus qingshengii]MBX9152239.1 XRE family transcriptional regulator [Rhodococcus qingshengii]UJC82196.1 XRE family transcriptional regulator [Rhodococcus erythropolis]